MTLVRDDSLGFNLEPGCHSYRVTRGERLEGAVVAASTSRGRQWVAFRVHPNRRQRWVVVAWAKTAKAAAAALGGRP
jgi:hypothetical protein